MRFITAFIFFLSLCSPSFSQIMEDQLQADSLSTSQNFGKSNAIWISGDHAFVGDPDDNGGRGAVSVFERSTRGTWSLKGVLRDANALPNDGFGRAIAGDGRYLIVGEHYGDDLINGVADTGAAFIYDLVNPTAPPTRLPLPAGFSAGDMFGIAVDICSTSNPPLAVVGGPRTDALSTDEGTVLVYNFDGTTWVHQSTIDTVPGSGSLFGRAVAITSNPNVTGQVEMIVGAPGGGAGDVIFFHYNFGGWVQISRIIGSGSTFGDGFGISVAIDEDFAAVGAYTEDIAGQTKAGAAYVFKRGAGGWPTLQTQEDFRIAGVNQDDWLGLDVDIVKTGPDSALFVAGHSRSDERGTDAGSIHFVERTGPGTWSPAEELTPVYGDSGWRFGDGVAIGISGSRRLVMAGARVAKLVQVFDIDRDSSTFTGPISISPRLMPGDNTFKTYSVEQGASVEFIFGTRLGNAPHQGCTTVFGNPRLLYPLPVVPNQYGEAECTFTLPIYTVRFGIQAVEYIPGGACLSISAPIEF